MAQRRIRCTMMEVFPGGPLSAARHGRPPFQEVSPWSDPLVSQLLQRLLSQDDQPAAVPQQPADSPPRAELPPPRDGDWSFGGLDPAFDDPWHRE